MMRTDQHQLFISRQLKEDSPILIKYPKGKYSWTDQSMIEFSPVSFQLPDCEWLFFYSKNGVKYLKQSEQAISHLKIACLGPGTGAAYKLYFDDEADFVGTGEKHSTTKELQNRIANKKICFVRGKHSIRSIQKLLHQEISQVEVVVYNNEIVSKVILDHYEVAIITSPMNYKGFLKNGGISKNIIAIGNTTAKKVREINAHLGIDTTLCVAESPTEKALLSALEKLI